MGVRGELFTTQINLDNRSYFFNVKENRAGDVFLQVVESKNKNGEDFDRHAIVVFAEDMQKFCKGFEESLAFIEKDRKEKKKNDLEKKAAKAKKTETKKKVYTKKTADKTEDRVKRTGKVHVVSKRNISEE